VGLTTFTLLTVTLALFTFTVDPGEKLNPVSVTFTLAPGAPAVGAIDVSDASPDPMLNFAEPLVPLYWSTMTLNEPEAVAGIWSVAVICVVLTTFMLLTMIVGLVRSRTASTVKLEPVRVTSTFAPGAPALGAMDVSDGPTSVLILNVTELLETKNSVLVTLTLTDPVAPGAIANVAVI